MTKPELDKLRWQRKALSIRNIKANRSCADCKHVFPWWVSSSIMYVGLR